MSLSQSASFDTKTTSLNYKKKTEKKKLNLNISTAQNTIKYPIINNNVPR